jgi:hypothetical protein
MLLVPEEFWNTSVNGILVIYPRRFVNEENAKAPPESYISTLAPLNGAEKLSITLTVAYHCIETFPVKIADALVLFSVEFNMNIWEAATERAIA